MSRHATLLAALVMSGCLGAQTDTASNDGHDFAASSYASLSRAYGDGAQSGSDFTWSPRGGFVVFMGTNENVAPRITLGGYTRALETDTQRLEVGIDLTPETGGDEENLYATLTGDYAYFLGQGTFSLKAGGGAAYEWRAGETYALLLVQVGMGLWVPIGRENAFVANAMVQVPLGEANPSSMLAVTAGYEF